MLDLSQTATPAQIQENLIAYMRLFAGLSDFAMRDDDAFWFVSHRAAPGDGIFRTRWSMEGAEDHIDRLLEQIGRLTYEIDWMVFPCDQPANLDKRLEARGLPGGLGGYWLWADLASLAPAPPAPRGFHIEPVRDDAGMAIWLQASEAGFGGEFPWFYDAYARHGYRPDAASRHFIGYQGDQPVTYATLLEAGGCASIYDVSTPPEFRNQGFGGAISYSLMAQVQARGYTDTWVWSSQIAKSVYQKLGFRDADFGIREYHWKK